MSDSGLKTQIINALRTISAHDLQIVAEAIALHKFRSRFGRGTMIRNGRNDDAQTTKNWPDAYIATSGDMVDGIEATRDRNNWLKHLAADFDHAKDPAYHNLSGYVFVGGYPDNTPTGETVRDWIGKFASLGIPYDRITILVGRDLVAELEDPSYAQVRMNLLGIRTAPKGFRPASRSHATNDRLALFQPSDEEFERGYVGAPAILDDVINLLDREMACAILGVGAAGKTTLAKLIAHSPRILPSPTWFADLANPDIDEDELITGMTNFAGDGVLFVIDNTHLATTTASNIVQHWEKYLRTKNTRILALGRKTRQSDPRLLGLKTFELRAGMAEMEAVVSRLFRRLGLMPPNVGATFLRQWAEEFGGSSDPASMAVDLIAFTAAADQRFSQFQKGDYRLAAGDAVAAVHAKYLAPLKQGDERNNLLTLASLSHFEIPLPSELVADSTQFSHQVAPLGIVVEDGPGEIGALSYKLVHPALGALILKAASGSFDVQMAREDLAGRNPALGARMLSNKKQASGKAGIEAAMEQSVRSGKWKATVFNIRDLSTIVRLACRKKWLDHDALDAMLVADGWFGRLLGDARTIRDLSDLQVALRRFALRRCLDLVEVHAADPFSQLHSTLLVSPPSSVASVLRRGNAETIVTALSAESWNERQVNVDPESVDNAVSAARFFQRLGRAELAVVPLKRVVQADDLALWRVADLGHLSNLLRLAQLDNSDLNFLMDMLFANGWVGQACNKWALGPLCGGVMSLANHLPAPIRQRFVCRELTDRVLRELSGEFWIGSYWRADAAWTADKQLSRPVCLLGAYNSLGGDVTLPPIAWPEQLLEKMLDGIRPRNDAKMGMYELELWLGLKAFAAQGLGPGTVSPADGDRFLSVLSRSVPPTQRAEEIQQELLIWLAKCRGLGWNLVP